MAKRTIIKNGTVVFPDLKKEEQKDILIEGTKIVAIEQNITDPTARTIDAQGLHIVPGLIDMHVHLREPGQEYKEDIESGTRAAAAGGFTSIACMPNTSPVVDSPELVKFLVDKTEQVGRVNVFPIGAITKGLLGNELSEMGLMRAAGAVSFSDDGKYVCSSEVMKNALLYARALGITLISHCEDPFLAEGGVMNEGYFSTILGLKGIPDISESIAVARDIALCEKYGPVHIAHISTKKSVELIRRAKAAGVPVTCETAPHYLWFTDENVISYSPNFKMNPPLRSTEDRAALIEGIKDGTIDVVATDHAPHSEDEKMCEFGTASFGIIGLETALPAILTKLFHEQGLPLWYVISTMTTGPARVLGINKGKITKDGDADLTIIDINKTYKVEKGSFRSKASNSPFVGIEVKGKVVYTLVNGKIVYQNGV